MLDTHFLLWTISHSSRLRQYPWLDDYRPWHVSPISVLEIQLLWESGRKHIDNPRFSQELGADPRFQLDEASLVTLIHKSLQLGWTRDPFDRLIAAHSLARRIPLCSIDEVMLKNHKLIVPELR